MKLLFILDPLSALKRKKDTSLAIMHAAQQRGHTLFVAEQHALFLQQARAKVLATPFSFAPDETNPQWYQLGIPNDAELQQFDAIFMRKDPPFDKHFLYSTYLLEIAAQQGARVFNHPASIRDWNEKLAVTHFPQLTPPFIVTADMARIRTFLGEHGDIVVKPLDGMGGAGVFRITPQDPNIGAILETITANGTTLVMAQKYLPEITQGDKRILMIDGKPLDYALARIPQNGETRGNLAAGGKGVAQPLSARDLHIAQTVGAELKKRGLFLVGLDVIGDYLTEINVTSPTGMVEIAAQTLCKPAEIFMDALENHLTCTP